VNEHFDLRPKGIIQMLDLLRPIYRKTAAYGHFGARGAGVQLGEDRQGGGRR
jgi:S-adenosylmethionine synthetase